MGATISQPIYSIEDIPGKGKGLVATKDIPKGARIISDNPIISVGHVPSTEQVDIHIYQRVTSLSEDEQREFFSMDNIYPYTNSAERSRGIFRTNALPMGPDLDTGGIFFKACRINHACNNNAQNFWNENINQLTIHAIRDVRRGEEITIFYLRSRRNRKARQEELRANFQFTCACQLCSLPDDQSRASDAKLDRVYELDCIVDGAGIEALVSRARGMLSCIDEQVRLWSETGPDEVGLARAYPDAFQVAVANGDLARGRVFAERLVPLYLSTMGEDSPDVSRYRELIRDPSGHDCYGMSMKWETTVDEVPRGLGSSEFEDWLWRRKEMAQEQRAHLRNREAFPTFSDLPNSFILESDYFEGENMASRRPSRHWCFLAEILDITSFICLQMAVRDFDGVTVPLFFHTDSRGAELPQSLIRKGYTVAILYAVRHAFKFSEPGILHENPQMMKVRFPNCEVT